MCAAVAALVVPVGCSIVRRTMVNQTAPPIPHRSAPRKAYIGARVTPKERALLETVAAEFGATLSDTIRYLAVQRARELQESEP